MRTKRVLNVKKFKQRMSELFVLIILCLIFIMAGIAGSSDVESITKPKIFIGQ
jgi:hypothetical protein